MAFLVDGSGRPSSGVRSHPVHAKVVDNHDADGPGGRVKLELIAEAGSPKTPFVRLLTPNGGNERGFYNVPEIGEHLIVLFDRGSQDEAIVLGSYWCNESKIPTEAKDGMPGSGKTDTKGKKSTDKFTDGSTDLKNNDRRLWRSRSGHIICLDDTAGKETIQIWDKNHELCIALDSAEGNILITNTNNDIHIRSANDLYLEAGAKIQTQAGDNIEIDTEANYELNTEGDIEMTSTGETKITAKKDFTVEGMNVKMTGKTEVKIKGNSTATYEGGTVTLKGSSSATISAGSVSIN
jgi:phage baseplate assembly protein gpV